MCIRQARKDMLLTYEAKQRALGAFGGALFKAIWGQLLTGKSVTDLGFVPKWEA